MLYALFQLFFMHSSFAQDGTKNSGLTLRVTVAGVSTDFGEFECGYGTADFGASLTDDICAPAQWAHDVNGLDSLVCDSIPAGSLSGKIALVRRGGCPVAAAGNFTAKAENAQKAGALAVLIANHSANAAENDCFSRQLFGPAPAVNIPVLFLSRVVANFIDAAIQSGSPVEICLYRPDVSLVSTFYPVQNVQTPVSQIAQDTLGFSANVTNVRGTDLTNVKIKASVQTTAGAELFSTTLTIPSLTGDVVDSVFAMPDLFVPELPVNNYRIVYSTESDPISGNVFKDARRLLFNVTDNLFAKDDNVTIGFQPSPLPSNGWGLGNLYVMSTGALDHYKVNTAVISNNSASPFWPVNKIVADLFLFKVTDEVAADYANFEEADFLSPSFQLLGTGSYVAPANATGYQLQQVTLFDLNTADPGVLLENGKHYVLGAFYADSNAVAFNGFDEDVEVAGPQGIGTITYSDKWYLGGFVGGPSGTLRMFIDLVVTTDEKPLPDSYMQVFPNPVKDVLNLGLGFEKPTDVTITIAEISGRTLRIEDKFGLTNETLTYNLPQLTPGTYLARIATKEGTLTKKFLVQK
jgi:hypothetical protein